MILILMNTFNLKNKELYEIIHQKQPQQPSSVTQNLFGQYYRDSGSNLLDYQCCWNI